MDNLTKPIEDFFLESLLKLSLVGILLVISVDYYFTRFEIARSWIVDFAILLAIIVSFMLYKFGAFVQAVLVIAFITLAAMFYQSVTADSITTSSMAVVMVVGFGFSVLLKKEMPWILHGLTIIGMITVFYWLAMHPTRYGKPNPNDIIVAGVTYLILYIIVAYSSKLLKHRYDEFLSLLAIKNRELIEKSNEIEAQNEELIQSQESLHQLNNHLESIVNERTGEVQKQNEQLIQYAYSNAHHVRGPVARVLGLIQLAKMDTNLDYPSLFQKIEEQTIEIDTVVKTINTQLQK